MRSPEGGSVNAVRGYLDMVSYLVSNRRPAATVHTFDADWRPQWRVDQYSGYKAARAGDTPELEGEFERILELLVAAGLPVVAAPGYEADDVIGTLAAREEDLHHREERAADHLPPDLQGRQPLVLPAKRLISSFLRPKTLLSRMRETERVSSMIAPISAFDTCARAEIARRARPAR